MKAQSIRVMHGRCKCGCLGRDPWHKASYKRVVTGIRKTDILTMNGRIVAVGMARFPWGEEPVRLKAGQLEDGTEYVVGWEVDR